MKKLLAILVACLMPICLIAESGDVNGDGKVSKADIDAIIGYIMKTSPNVTKESADLNEDGDVNAADIVEFIKMINQPVIITDNIGDWSEMRAFADGSLITVKNMGGRETPEEVLMILPSDELGIMYSYIKFDENGMPQYITINENTIIVDSYYDNLVDLTVVYENTTANMYKGLPFKPSGVSKTRAWSDNNGARNATAIVELVSGITGVGIGAAYITGSLVAGAGTGGAGVPISIPGIIAGTATITGGVNTFRTGWNKIFLPGAHSSNIAETIGGQIVSTMYTNLPEYAYENGAIPERYAGYLRDPNYANTLNRLGGTNFFVGLAAGIADNIYGRTVTWDDTKNFYYQKDENGNEKVVTGLCKDITLSSATLRGYISPSITVSRLDGSPLDNEYGIVVFSESNPNERYIQKCSGSGGMIEFTFNNLKPNTIYNYRTYYLDKTNVISLLGDLKPFITVDENKYLTCPDGNHPHMIDLGLPSGTLWACCNVGAHAPEEYGNYYAWGEVRSKSSYFSSNYLFQTLGDILTLGYLIRGTSFDAATMNWGSRWQMPFKSQFEELLNNTKSERAELNDVYGRVFIGRNGSRIFLPCAGNIEAYENWRAPYAGIYWTSFADYNEPYWSYPQDYINENWNNSGYLNYTDIWTFSFADDDVKLTKFFRSRGNSVRPVCK